MQYSLEEPVRAEYLTNGVIMAAMHVSSGSLLSMAFERER